MSSLSLLSRRRACGHSTSRTVMEGGQTWALTTPLSLSAWVFVTLRISTCVMRPSLQRCCREPFVITPDP